MGESRHIWRCRYYLINTLSLDKEKADNSFKYILVKEKFHILISISMKLIYQIPTDNTMVCINNFGNSLWCHMTILALS